MAIYGTFYINGVLNAAKWPRKQGILGKDAVDVTVLDVALDQMIDWSAGVGAGRPNLAVGILASLYNDSDWDTAGSPNFELFVNSQDQEYLAKNIDLNTTAPHDLQEISHFRDSFGKSVPYKILDNPKTRELIETTFVCSLLYGLSHPNGFKEWYKYYLEEFETNKATYEKIGLGVDRLPSLDEYFSNAEDVISLYLQEMDKILPDPNSKILIMANNIRK